jgi:PBP1b-binding outer membrane lipoprotein LpoB
MQETIRISAVLAIAVLLAACAKKEETVAPEPAASAPVEMTEPEAAPVDSAPMAEDSAPMAEDAMTEDAMTEDAMTEGAAGADDMTAADAEDAEIERAGGDRVAQ